ncbi:MAG: hypothetical protein [Microviridae sp.]|nr:MAG: hypothetical protein [Microviridae sp.]
MTTLNKKKKLTGPSMEIGQPKKSELNGKKADNSHGTGEDEHYPVTKEDKEYYKDELIQRDEVENTPFVMITIKGETFGTFGKYRITEPYHTKQQCKVELQRVDWNRIVQVCTLINEMMKNQTTK